MRGSPRCGVFVVGVQLERALERADGAVDIGALRAEHGALREQARRGVSIPGDLCFALGGFLEQSRVRGALRKACQAAGGRQVLGVSAQRRAVDVERGRIACGFQGFGEARVVSGGHRGLFDDRAELGVHVRQELAIGVAERHGLEREERRNVGRHELQNREIGLLQLLGAA
ncbi:MAG TPA: hypothetical protein VK524_30750, partial [Polyangiaceae bacterium]|nr:hypothetical protein [Polyangiaceae bacterium]